MDSTILESMLNQASALGNLRGTIIGVMKSDVIDPIVFKILYMGLERSYALESKPMNENDVDTLKPFAEKLGVEI